MNLDQTLVDAAVELLNRRFPAMEGAGVIVFMAPDERRLEELLARADSELFRAPGAGALPLEGRKVRWHIGAAEAIGGSAR